MKTHSFISRCLLAVGAALLALTAYAPAASAQIGIRIGRPGYAVEYGEPPVCQYGYYDYEPYECAPYGYYGDGYFYNGIFLGVGPWGGYGYNHGWGGHRLDRK